MKSITKRIRVVTLLLCSVVLTTATVSAGQPGCEPVRGTIFQDLNFPDGPFISQVWLTVGDQTFDSGPNGFAVINNSSKVTDDGTQLFDQTLVYDFGVFGTLQSTGQTVFDPVDDLGTLRLNANSEIIGGTGIFAHADGRFSHHGYAQVAPDLSRIQVNATIKGSICKI